MLAERRKLAYMHSDFYRHKYLKIARAINIVTMIIVFLTLVIIYQILTVKNPDFYASTTEGKLIPLTVAVGSIL